MHSLYRPPHHPLPAERSSNRRVLAHFAVGASTARSKSLGLAIRNGESTTRLFLERYRAFPNYYYYPGLSPLAIFS